jgi:hypothetical protein
MSNPLRGIIRSLRAELVSPRYARDFEAARRRHNALAGYHTITSVLRVLHDENPSAYPERDALTRALLFEQQHAPSPFWSSALLTAYYPMLSRLRFRIIGDTVLKADLDQAVITSFLNAVSSVSLTDGTDRIAMRLKSQTQTLFLRFVQDVHRHEEALCFKGFDEFELPEDAAWPDTCDDFQSGPRNSRDAAEAISTLLSFAGDATDGETFDFMTVRFICKKHVSVYLQKMLPDLREAERWNLYQKIKRRHSRAMARIRAKIADKLCPHSTLFVLPQWRKF